MEKTREVAQLKRKVRNLETALSGKEKPFYKSKKFFVMALTAIVVSSEYVGLKGIDLVVYLACSYIVGQGLSDFGKNKR
jgi:hypothetical protein